jgi:hypothetical protein
VDVRVMHLCDPSHRDEVLREGLRPTPPEGDAPPGVYVWLREDLVPAELAKAAARGQRRDVWAALVPGGSLVPDPELPPGHAARVPERIPPERLSLVRPHRSAGEGRGAA